EHTYQEGRPVRVGPLSCFMGGDDHAQADEFVPWRFKGARRLTQQVRWNQRVSRRHGDRVQVTTSMQRPRCAEPDDLSPSEPRRSLSDLSPVVLIMLPGSGTAYGWQCPSPAVG